MVLGESKPIKGTTESTDDNYLETRCIGLQGTHCVSGTAIGLVVETGDSTVFGQIAKLAAEPKSTLTTIEKEIFRFVLLIFAIMVTWIVVLASVWCVPTYLNFLCSHTASGELTARVLIGEGGFGKNIPTGSVCLPSS